MALNEIQKVIAIDLATGVSQRVAADRHGVHYMTITLWKRSSEFVDEIERLRKQFRKVANADMKGGERYGN